MTVRFQNPFVLLTSAMSVCFIGCAPVSFDGIPASEGLSVVGPQKMYDAQFPLAESTQAFDQLDLDTNSTSLSFQVIDQLGNHISILRSEDLVVTENGTRIPNFKLNSNSMKIVETVDIALVVDITGSMGPTIEAVKTRLIEFVNRSRMDGFRTRICLSTFGDLTVQKCDRFYDNNPDDPATQTQVRELISEISKLRAISGQFDPGGSDFDENPMRALIDVAQAPWAPQGNRFVILVTDNGFLYSPGNSGEAGPAAPEFSETLNAIRRSQLKIFAATPSRPGYNRPFRRQPGIVEASQGEWFEFERLLRNEITLTTILNRILNRVQTSYVVQYVADEIPGLDPTRPLNSRQISVSLAPSVNVPAGTTVRLQQVQSNLPNGRQDYLKEFKLSDKSIDPDSLEIRINGETVSRNEVALKDGRIVLSRAPKKRARIQVRYRFQNLADALQMQPIVLSQVPQDVIQNPSSRLRVMLNQRPADREDFKLERSQDGTATLLLSERALSEKDPYFIRKNQGLRVQIELAD